MATTQVILTIAVIGAAFVGKSTFIQRVLNLSRPPISNASQSHRSVDQVDYIITLLELELDSFSPAESDLEQSSIQWPKHVNGYIVPRIDGALYLYDVTNKSSIIHLPQIIAVLANPALPSALVACKCDRPRHEWRLDAGALADHNYFKSCVAKFQLSLASPDAADANACLNTILRVVIAVSGNAVEAVSAGSPSKRSRAQSLAKLETGPDSVLGGFSNLHNGGHSRAGSDVSGLNVAVFSSASAPRSSSRSPIHSYQHSPVTSSTLLIVGEASSSAHSRTPGWRPDRTANDSFLDIEESDADHSEDTPILQRNDESVYERPAKNVGIAFETLVDRLLALKMTKAEHNFADIFLCLYRKFAAPSKLLTSILIHLDRVRDDKTAHYLSRTATQLRIVEIVAKWVSIYPGDFARPATRQSLEDLIHHLSTEPIFCFAAQQMRRVLDLCILEDEDAGWAESDDGDGHTVVDSILVQGTEPSLVPVRSIGRNNGLSSPSGPDLAGSDLDQGSAYSSLASSQSHEESEREAAMLEPSDVLPLNKVRYEDFMNQTVEELADEMTRIDWVIFSSIRIRDLIRHVSLSTNQKKEQAQSRGLRSVNRMITHFNHVARWVASMILLRDKAKHRALMLERFIDIAARLRVLNNYNGLAAVLAGLNGTAIHRLSQTRALLPSKSQMRLARLLLLMGTQKSHFAYRLAWENSPLPRIPFIPLHRRDLISAEEGSRTLVGARSDRINWRKFEVLGDVLLPIIRSQSQPYPALTRLDPARELILDCRLPADDEELYQRSVQVESSAASGTVDAYKKKFAWFTTK